MRKKKSCEFRNEAQLKMFFRKNLEEAFEDFERIGRSNPFCIGIKKETELREIISGTMDHIERNNAKVLKYVIESWGRLAWLQDNRDRLQRIWDAYGLISVEDWLPNRRLILQNLEQMYKPQAEEYVTTVRRHFKTLADSYRFEEQLLEDLIARTGDLPKVMYVTLDINGQLYELRTAFQVKLDGLCLKRSDRAVLYVIDPIFYKRFKKPRPGLREMERLVVDLQRIFEADIYYCPGWDVIHELGIESRWYRLEESYKHG